jgi:two-component system, NtrC family, response regulator AtoC
MQSHGLCRTVLVCEDEHEVESLNLEMAVKYLGYSVEVARDGEEVLRYLTSSRSEVSAALLDLSMPGDGGIHTLAEIRRIDPQLPVIIVSSVATPNDIVAAMKSGATDFLCRPMSNHDLQVALDSALERHVSLQAAEMVPVLSGLTQAFSARSPRMQEISSLVPCIGRSDAPVLIQGETGCGKEVFARELHAISPRAGKVFLKLNCAALPSELVESELFGYERGAFTGAFQRRAGMFELANGGTLLLDEIGDMDVRLQAKLLQVLQDKEFRRIGGKETIKADVRVLAATHRDLETAIVNGAFRADLYYRLNVINIELPPLRERKEDIIPLTEFLLNKHARPGSYVPALTPNLKYALTAYHWAGNIRELENMVRRLIVLHNPDLVASELLAKAARKRLGDQASSGPAITAELPKSKANGAPAKAPILEQVTKAKQQAEAEAILAALDSTRWNRKQAAVLLQIDYKALLYKLKKLGLEDKTAAFDAVSAAQLS